MKSVYLKSEVYFNGLLLKSTATEIKHQNINDDEFKIPEDSIIKEK